MSLGESSAWLPSTNRLVLGQRAMGGARGGGGGGGSFVEGSVGGLPVLQDIGYMGNEPWQMNVEGCGGKGGGGSEWG